MVKANIVNSHEFREQIYKKLEPTGWNTALRMFIKSNEFITLIDKLKEEVVLDKRFTPTFKYVFKAFEECHYNDTRVIILGQDPYPQINVADGLAFSCSMQNKAEKQLEHIHSAIQKTVENAQPSVNNLQYLADQGVLLLNTALTTQIGKPGTHQEYWKPFMAHLLDYIRMDNPNIVYLLLGKKAEFWEDLIDQPDNVVKASHPASAAYAAKHEWDCNNCFNKVNEILASQELPKINW
jgi:uracil-DNA glycosylase